MLEIEYDVDGKPVATIGTAQDTCDEMDKLWWGESMNQVRELSEHLDFDILSVLPDEMKESLIKNENYVGVLGWLE